MPGEEFWFGPFANVLYFLGCLDPVGPISEKNITQIIAILEVAHEKMEYFGLHTSARVTENLIELLNSILSGGSPVASLHDQITVLRTSLMAELEATVFVSVNSSSARFYREPRKDWEIVINRFPETINDIEESGMCYALGRYEASVYHSMQVFEYGLLALGKFMQVDDPKSGFTAVSNALECVLKRKYDELSNFEKKNREFFAQVNQTIQAVKNACRNKISHAEGKAILMTADFKPRVALEIYISTQAFMRRLATEMPK